MLGRYMSAERFQRIEQMYHEALERRGEERDAFLRQACAGDESLLREVQSLLQQSGEGVLDRPVWSSVGTRYDSSQVMIGRRIAHFEITGRLGEGGMGAVYKARDQHLDRDVALKVLLPEAVANPDRRRRFVREAKAASGLAHPNIVHIYDINEADGELFIAMEYVAGKTLDQAIDRKGLPLRDVLRYAVPMADALAKAHAAGIVHRDLKPSNVMITADRVVKVLDFGLAKLVERESDPSESAETVAMQESLQTKEGTVVGTAAYMSPEQAEGRPVDGRSDIFSFGAMLYEMLTGNRAFAGATRMATISSVLRDEPRPVTEVRESVPKELERIITRCLRKDPDRRFQHMEDLRVALEEVKEESESSAIAPPPTPPAGGRKWIWPAAAAALLVIGGLAAWRFAAPKPGSGESAETTPVTTVPGLAIGASFSPDGKQIVYSSNRNGWFEIYTRPSAGTGPERQITTDGKQATEPAWSPDGKSIAYHSVALHGIWVIPVTGGEARKVSDFGSSPAWSPDGRQLAFRSYEPSSLAPSDWPGDGESTIWRVDADGSNLQQLTLPRSPLGQHADPTWSPDGKRIAFASLNIITMGFRGALFTVDAATSEIKPLSVGEIWGAANPVFSPDGKGVYFAGRPKFAASNGVYYSEFSDPPKAVELCRTKQASPARIAVSRDGKALMFTRLVNNSQIWITETGKEPKPLYQDLVVRARLPNFSPDGTRLTYQVQSDDATLGIWLMNADGSNPMRIAQDLGNANGASWDETGTRLTINHFGTGAKPGVVLIGLADGSRKTLLEGSFDMLRNHMTPDGKDFIYDFGTPRNIWKRPVAGGPPKQLTFSRRRAWFPEVSWDSNWIVYQVSEGDDSQIAVMNRDGSQQKILTSGPGKRFSHSFASDNRRIAFAGYVNGVWNLYWIDRVTAETKQITHSTAYGSFVRSPAWRPNTDQMAYEFSEVKGNIERLPLSR